MKLSEVCSLIVDTEHKTAPYVEHGIPSIRTPNVGRGRLILDKDIKFVDEKTYVAWTRRAIPEKNDLIIAREAPVGNVALVPETKLCLGQRTVLVRPDSSVVDPCYLCYFLLSPTMQYRMLSSSGGSTVAHLNMREIRSLELGEMPKLSLQKRIADILSAYDDLIENNLRRIQLLEEAARCRHKLLMEENSGWEKVKLYDFAYVQMGYAFDSKFFNEDGVGTPIIRIRDIPDQWTKSFSTQEADQVYRVLQGDILIGMDGEFHMNEWCGQEGYLVQRVCRLRANDTLYHSYLRQALVEPILFYQNTISGATVAHLGAKHLKEIFVPVPPSDIYSNQLEGLNKMRLLRINLYNQNTRLRQARDILLPRLMNGEIDITSTVTPNVKVADSVEVL